MASTDAEAIVETEWSKSRFGQAILDLRVILISGIWDEVQQVTLRRRDPVIPRPYNNQRQTPKKSPHELHA